MKKQQIIDKINQGWLDLQSAWAGLSDAQLTQPGVTEDWSVRDILAHVSWWEEESLKHLPDILAGKQPPRYSATYGGIDAFNALMTRQWQNLPLPEVLQKINATHERLVAYLAGLDEEPFKTETRFRRRLGWDSYKHYPIHAQAIREWRERVML
ncbi:MAG TPA: maleylpyruvate isomerase N-terminal domain-containing protein [Anaerolineaceae bacterium]|nr:maleylpyruvate isomerase N-terminal domain-containing protein [Anaerolineaceae bacterium]